MQSMSRSIYDYRMFTITLEIKIYFARKRTFLRILGALLNLIQSAKLTIYSGFEGDLRNELQTRQCEPPGPVLEASVPS
jgi:hypothetical protein